VGIGSQERALMAVFATDNFNRVDGSLGGNLTDGGEAPVFEMSRTLANQ
jgi:hypothetical protein